MQSHIPWRYDHKHIELAMHEEIGPALHTQDWRKKNLLNPKPPNQDLTINP
jgi:hypothetical protein